MPNEEQHTEAPACPTHAIMSAGEHDAILAVAQTLVSHDDLDTLLVEFLAEIIRVGQGCEAGILYLLEVPTAQLLPAAAFGYALTQFEPLSPALESPLGQALRTGTARVLTEHDLDHLHLREHMRVVGGPTARGALSIPLCVESNAVGIILLTNHHDSQAFANADLSLFTILGGLAALAISTARRQREALAAESLRQANRLKAELISILAHEMRTPLTSIKGYSSAMLMEEADFSPQVQREFLQIIDEECDILQDLIRDLLESSIIDAGLLKLEFQPVLIPRLAGNLIDDMAHRTNKHRFLVDFPHDFPIVDADPDRVAQVLRNLLDNAVKYSPAGGLIVVSGAVSDDQVTVSVADEGVGISPTDLNRLFERFFRAETGIGQHVVGSGLGLPISRTIIEGHGGRIWAESKLGKGSLFFFTIPLRQLTASELNA